MQKEFENNLKKAISKSARLLQPKRKRRTVVAKEAGSKAQRQFAKLKAKINPNGQSRKEAGKKRQKALKLWDQSFGGGFCYSMKKTADFLKEKRQKANEKKEKRRLRQKLSG